MNAFWDGSFTDRQITIPQVEKLFLDACPISSKVNSA
jgi:hypothetical protein